MNRNVLLSPAFGAALGQVAVALILAFGFKPSHIQAGYIEAVTVAAVGLIAAIVTRPFYYSAVTGFLLAALSLLIAYKVPHITPGLVSALNAVFAVFAFKIMHGNVTQVPAPGRVRNRPIPTEV